jgi:hypothetical protein
MMLFPLRQEFDGAGEIREPYRTLSRSVNAPAFKSDSRWAPLCQHATSQWESFSSHGGKDHGIASVQPYGRRI